MIQTIVITGGPCAGKTSAVSRVERTFPGCVATVAHVASHVQQVFPRPDMQTDVGAKLAVMRHLRIAAAHVQDELESAYVAMGRKLGVKLVLCDGGILDGAAYWPEGSASFLSALNLRKEEVCTGYRAIIHLESLAVSHPELYQQLARQHRHSPLGEAKLADEIIGQIWSGHNNYHFVPTSDSQENVQQAVIDLIRSLIPSLAQTTQPPQSYHA